MVSHALPQISSSQSEHINPREYSHFEWFSLHIYDIKIKSFSVYDVAKRDRKWLISCSEVNIEGDFDTKVRATNNRAHSPPTLHSLRFIRFGVHHAAHDDVFRAEVLGL